MSESFDDIEHYLVYICTGVKYLYLDDLFFVFGFPDNKDRQRANLIYDESFDKAVRNGILPVKQLEELVEKRNIITEEEIKKLNKLKSQLEGQEVLLGKTTRVKANQDRIKQVINRLKHEIMEIEFKKSSKLLMSAETKARKLHINIANATLLDQPRFCIKAKIKASGRKKILLFKSEK